MRSLLVNSDHLNHIVWLDQLAATDPACVGAKAASLARLAQAGLPVPEGFCVTTQAYRVWHVESGRDSAPLPEGLQQEVLEAYQCMMVRHGPRLRMAVRSSAVREDGSEASFAGQYVSTLNVTQSNLMDAIRECWQSACSARVRAYQTGRDLELGEASMAVLVQVMIPADYAGVLFTVNPLDAEGRMSVEMTPGLGDGVAGGTIIPVRLTLDKRGVASVHGQAQDVYPVKWSVLCELAERVEAFCRSPQDIEWACERDQFWILQSRPITACPVPARRQIWTRANVGEILPGVVSPLTWSVFQPILQAAGQYRAWSHLTLHWNWEHPCGAWPDSPRLFQGRAYLELGSVYIGFASLPGVTSDIMRRMLGFEFHLCRPDELPRKRPRWHVMDPYRAARFWLEMLGATRTLERQAGRWLRSRVDVSPLAEMRPEVELAFANKLRREAAQLLGLHIQCTSMAFSAFGLIDQVVRKHTDSEAVQVFEAGLIADFQNISTVQQTVAIWDLAQLAQRTPLVERVLLTLPVEQIVAAWGQADPGFLQAWQAFMAQFGDRSTQEFELSVAHWNEDPSFVLQRMREALLHQRLDPREQLNRQQVSDQVSLQHMLEQVRVRSTVEAWFLSRLVKSYKTWVPLRENLKYALVNRFNALRQLFIALGQHLAQNGRIADAHDVMFLQHQEIQDLIEYPDMPGLDARVLVERRQAEYLDHQHSSAADIWVSVDGRDMPMELPVSGGENMLQGIGCSPGLITAPACVLTTVEANMSAVPGQILVAPSIDPGLTPLFLSAAGLVTEIGGMLSHGATVAREYGLPAVVGVPHATRLIRNGQPITVDGFTGRVYLGSAECG